jgi:hypothetical protein
MIKTAKLSDMVNNTFKILTVTVLVILCSPAHAQVNPFLNLNGGYDLNINKYYSKYVYEKFEGKKDFNGGLALGITLGKRMRFRIGVNYAQLTYGQTYPSGFLTDNTGTSYTESTMTLHAIHMDPALDGRLFSFKKFDLYITAGYRFEWITGHDEESIKSGGETVSSSYLDRNYPKANGGPHGGLIVKYNAGKHLGITLEPAYTYYLKELYYQNDGNLQRFSANIGIAYTFLTGKNKANKNKDEPFE